MKTRIERDSMGEVHVPKNMLYGAQTQRAVDNFPVSGLQMPGEFIEALAYIKEAAATTNQSLGLLDRKIADAIQAATKKIRHDGLTEHFPVDVFQTGSGTSSNMNINEVIANLCHKMGNVAVNPNDHVNMGQSSNDVIPTAIHVSAVIAVTRTLLPGLAHLQHVIENKAESLEDVCKTGRTHLMDAMPITFSQELGGWAAQIEQGIRRIEEASTRLRYLPQGGTAVGTGINAHESFADSFGRTLSELTEIEFQPSDNHFALISAQDGAVALSGQLKVVAVSLMKIANDLRLMNSGPLAGFNEIELEALQPGSSIMPGKVNPVVPESVAMVAAHVIGNDAAITVAGQSGNFQLNVMLPVIAYNLLQSIKLLANSSRLLADKTIAGFVVKEESIARALSRNPILVTALNPVIGYMKAAEIAKKSYAEGRPVIDVAHEMTNIPIEQLRKLLDARDLTQGGLRVDKE